jgi:Tfp pilus assembly protein PilF
MLQSFKKILLLAGAVFSFSLSAQPAYIFLQKGNEKWERGDQVGALADFNQALQKDPRHFESLLTRGRFYFKTGKKDLALADFAKALEVKPGNADVLLLRAECYQLNKEHDKALDDLNQVIKNGAPGSRAFEMRAMLRLAKGEADKAETDFEQGMKAGKLSAAGWRNAALLKQKKEKHDIAVNYFSEALKSDAADNESFTGMASSLLALGGKASAQKGLVQLAEFEKRGGVKDASFYKLRFYLNKEAGLASAAKEDLVMLLDKLKVKDPALQQERAKMSLEQGQNADALKQVNKVLATDRNNTEMLLQRAEIYFSQGKSKFPMALNDLRHLTELMPANKEAWRLMTLVYVEDGKWDKGQEAAAQWVKLKPEAEAYYMRSKCCYRLGNMKACCSDLEKAASMGHAEAAKDKGVVCR